VGADARLKRKAKDHPSAHEEGAEPGPALLESKAEKTATELRQWNRGLSNSNSRKMTPRQTNLVKIETSRQEMPAERKRK
jgi:hypothetical protein